MAGWRPQWAVNHMAAPGLSIEAFCALAGRLGVSGVELRNDLSGAADFTHASAERVRAALGAADLQLLTVNALYPFNLWTGERAEAAQALAEHAWLCGCKALVLVPLNDGTGIGAERHDALRAALTGLAPILEKADLVGLVEPLGFGTSSLRRKSEAVAAIRELGLEGRFRLVHDTFHHHLAGEADLYPEMTGLVHVSGVEDQALPVERMLDDHRVLVGPGDRLGNVAQIGALLAGGCTAPCSFEPFATSVHDSADPEGDLRASMAFVEQELALAEA